MQGGRALLTFTALDEFDLDDALQWGLMTSDVQVYVSTSRLQRSHRVLVRAVLYVNVVYRDDLVVHTESPVIGRRTSRYYLGDKDSRIADDVWVLSAAGDTETEARVAL